MNKSNKCIILLIIISIILTGCNIKKEENKNDNLNNNNNEMPKEEEKYVFEKYLETDFEISNQAKTIETNDVLFLYDFNNEYIRVYDQNKKDITPDEIKNKIIGAHDITHNDEFLGYIVRTENKAYYINKQGKITIETNNHNINNIDNYINVDSDIVCSTREFNGDEYNDYCTKLYDLKGNLLIDGTKEKYYIKSVIYNDNNNPLFLTEKDNKEGALDKNGNVIIDFKYDVMDLIKNRNIILARKGDELELNHLYDVKGNLLKEININNIKIEKESKYKYFSTLKEDPSYRINDSIYIIDNNYELKQYENIYYNVTQGEDYGQHFYITDYIYIKNNNNTYTVHDLKGKQIIDEEFKFVGPTNPNGIHSIGIPNDYITLCKNSNRTNCGAIDFKGNVVLNFENELYNYKEDKTGEINYQQFNGFKKENQYFDIIDGKVTNKLTCDSIDGNIQSYYKNVVTIEKEATDPENYGRKVIDYKCNELSETKYYNIFEYNDFILGEQRDSLTYDVYSHNGIMLEYEKKDEGKTNNFLGYTGSKLYFATGKNVYILYKRN